MDCRNSLAGEQKLPATLHEVYYYHCNPAGLPEDVTNSQGEIVWRGRYSTWGKLVYEHTTRHAPADFSQPLRMQGQYDDGTTGLYYNTFRYYDADAGRFSAEDPIGLAGGMNLYKYAPNPMAWADPLGLDLKYGNTSAVGGWHQKVYVENNTGQYGISFGMSNTNDPMQWNALGSTASDAPALGKPGSGVVYQDNANVIKVQDTFETTPEEDQFIENYMQQQIGKTGPYNIATSSCRTYSSDQFDKIKDMITERRKNGVN